jgi:hypothetical protein
MWVCRETLFFLQHIALHVGMVSREYLTCPLPVHTGLFPFSAVTNILQYIPLNAHNFVWLLVFGKDKFLEVSTVV